MDFKSVLVDSSRNVADMVGSALGNDAEKYRAILNIVFEDDKIYANRATRVLELVGAKYPEILSPHIDQLTERLPCLQQNGVRRGITKILSINPLTKDEDLLGHLIECCFTWLIDQHTPIAIKVYCMTILYNAVKQIPELKEELRFAIEEQMPEGSAGFRSRGKKILKGMKNM